MTLRGRRLECEMLYLAVLLILMPSMGFSYNILVIRESDAPYSAALEHINVSVQFLANHFGFDSNLIITDLILNVSNPSNISICSMISSGTGCNGIISLVTSQSAINTVYQAAQYSQIPTIQIFMERWSPNGTFDVVPPGDLPNYIPLISPISVFQNIYEPLFPLFNISGSVSVVFDSIYGTYLTTWQEVIDEVHSANGVKTSFIPMATNSSLSGQVASLVKASPNILILGETASIETFVYAASDQISNGTVNIYVWTKDITPFKCDDCRSVEIFWIRPYYTGKELWIRDMFEYLKENQIIADLSYKLNGNNQVEISFFLTAATSLVQIMRDLNDTKGAIPEGYSCVQETSPVSNDNATSPFSFFLNGQPREYGTFVQAANGAVYQSVPGRVFKIDRIRGLEDARYNKLLANWTLEAGVQLYYGSLGVDVRELNFYRVALLIQPPFVERFPDVNTGPNYTGYCIELMTKLVSQINISYEYFEVEDGTFGSTDINGNWNGLIGALVSGSADIALAPLSVMAERENDVDFTVPYYDLVGTTILMKKPDVEYSLFKFMKVLEWPVWLCIVGAYLFTSLLLWVFDRFSPYSYTNNKERYKEDHEKRIFSLKECLWFCMTSLTPQGGGEAPKNVSGRLVAATWWLFGFIIIASYTANLAAFLTVSRLETTINSLDDLAKQYKIEYAPIKGSASETYFRRMAEVEEIFYNIWKEMSLNESMTPEERSRLAVWDYPVSDKFTNMWRYMQESKLPENISAAVDRVINSADGFAFIGDATEIKYAVLTNCKLQQVGTEFSRKPYAIAVQSGHPLKDPISSAILVLLNNRTLETLKDTWWDGNSNKVKCPDMISESDGISIQNIGGVFIVILAGIVLSLFTLGIEYLYYKRYRKSTITKVTGDHDHKGDIIPVEKGTHMNGTLSQMVSSTNGTALKHRKETHPTGVDHPNQITYNNEAFQY